MSTVGFSKGDSSATYTSFRGGGILANYNKEDYPKYDNYNAIEVSRTANIPIDYN